MTRLGFTVLFLVCAGTTVLPAQQNDEEANTHTNEPVPYTSAEFPPWTRDLRRGEIIAVGTLPIAMIVSGLFYQIGRFSYQSYSAGEATMEYAPWFLSTSNEPRYDDAERRGLILSGVGISVVVAVVDYVLGKRREFRIPD